MIDGDIVDVNLVNESLAYVLPTEIVSKISLLMTILQAVGIMVIIYLIFNIINWRINKRKRAELTQINNTLVEIKDLLKAQNPKKRK